MKITIYAEDTYSIAPILARKITGVMPDFQQISLNDMLSLKSFRTHIYGAAGGCTVFVIDREGARSHERPGAIRQICGNFQLLCEELERNGWPVRIALVIIDPNQEAWIKAGLGTLCPGKIKVYQKSYAPKIAEDYLQPENIGCGSFDYFKKIITGEIQDGCKNDYHLNQCGR